MRSKIILVLFCLFLLLACDSKQEYGSADIIPRPNYYMVADGMFTFNSKIKVVMQSEDEVLRYSAEYLAGILREITGFEVPIVLYDEAREVNKDFIISAQGLDSIREHGYEFTSRRGSITLQAKDKIGMFYGIQSFLQLLPAEVLAGIRKNQLKKISIPRITIIDYPRFEYRGMQLDVSRHFFPKEFILKFIDLMAFYKFNTFHWHLTDDNGWRLEIDKYPLLTETSAWRADHEDEPWRDNTPQREGEEATYGGFYTKEEVREVLAYAKERFITVIPEIEMPGHTSEVFAAYPELSCSGEKLSVQTGGYWPNKDIFCAGKEETFEFIENVLDEVCELFPSEYIHIGGDEAFKEAWENCPLCQTRIRKEGLKNEHELQSYFIKRIEKYLNAKGKKLIGWDEILEGGLAPEATVMSWRGMQGGIDAAKQGHDVIMTPTSHCYFDYYQANPEFEPEAIGGFASLKKVYSFEPIPEELSEEEAKHILGTQANIWTEYIASPEHAEYMAIPRMLALAEVAWSPAEKKNWRHFNKRLQNHFKYFDLKGINYSKGSYEVKFNPEFDTIEGYKMSLSSEQYKAKIYYTTDGSDPDTTSSVYKDPIQVQDDIIIKAGIFKNAKLKESLSVQDIKYHKGIGKSIKFDKKFEAPYNLEPDLKALDGLGGGLNHGNGKWLALREDDIIATIDLGELIPIHELSSGFYQRNPSWIFLPSSVEYYLSNDGEEFEKLSEIKNGISVKDKSSQRKNFYHQLDKMKMARYVKVVAKNIKVCPKGHPGEGERAWLFIDEISIK